MKQFFSTSKQQILKICSAALLCFTLMGNPNTLYSQQSGNANDSIYDFQLNDGSIITGVLVSDDSREVTISTQKNGKIIVPKYTIKSRSLKMVNNQNSAAHARKNPLLCTKLMI